MLYLKTPKFFMLGMLTAFAASATSVPRISFEQLIDRSELVVTGQIVRSWSDWDASHHNIWTHHVLAVASVQKGKTASTVVLSEPGGVFGGLRQTVVGAVQYQPGEKVVVFLERMPNGYLRTTGWSQGKYSIDDAGRVHASAALAGLELVAGKMSGSVPPDGITSAQLTARVLARVRSQQTGTQGRIQ